MMRSIFLGPHTGGADDDDDDDDVHTFFRWGVMKIVTVMSC